MKTAALYLFLTLSYLSLTAQIGFVEDLNNGGRDHQNTTVTKLDRPYGVITSPDDRFLYNACIDDNSIVVFERDISTGQLTFVESLSTNSRDQAGNLINGLIGAVNLVISEDGKHIYVAGLGNNVTVFSRDLNTGILTYIEALGGASISSLHEPINIGISPDGKSVYVTARGGNAGSITVFSRNEMTGRLTFVESLIDNGMDQAGNVVDKIRKPYGIQVSADNKYVYAASNQEASITLFSRDLMTGVLTEVDVVSKDGTDQAGNPIGNALFGSNNLDISDDGLFVYVSAFSDDAISVFSRDISTGILTFIQTLKNSTADGSGNMITALDAPQVVFATDNRVYAATGVGRSVVVFERNPMTGLLSFLEAKVDEVGDVSLLNDPEGMTLSRDHQFIYATGDEDDGITVFRDLQSPPPLPVELVYFKGRVEKQQAILNWETASEIQNEGFFVERSSKLGTSTWETLGFVKGYGDKLSPSYYEYRDETTLEGTYYYRLHQKDWDGTSSFSEVIALSVQERQVLQIYPNPSEQFVRIEGIPTEEITSVNIFTVFGKLAKSFHPKSSTVTLADLPKGTYLIEIQVGKIKHIQSFIKN
ncbi:MAG: beta-propeller fold lactonase family protein [Bacteroidota bacterium]